MSAHRISVFAFNGHEYPAGLCPAIKTSRTAGGTKTALFVSLCEIILSSFFAPLRLCVSPSFPSLFPFHSYRARHGE
jgi:hypothetical protein